MDTLPTAILEAFSCGIVGLNDVGQVAFMNSEAEAVFNADDGLGLDVNRHCIATLAGNQRRLRQMHDELTAGVGTGALIDRPSAKLAYCLTATPLLGAGQAGRHDRSLPAELASLIVIQDPDCSGDEKGLLLHQRLRRLYGLTNAEAHAVTNVNRCHNLVGAAKALGVSYHTVHTHIARSFRKLGARNQSDMARRLEAIGLLREVALIS